MDFWKRDLSLFFLVVVGGLEAMSFLACDQQNSHLSVGPGTRSACR